LAIGEAVSQHGTHKTGQLLLLAGTVQLCAHLQAGEQRQGG
jgi:hypothetical protein